MDRRRERPSSQDALPTFMFVERAVVAEPVSVEVDRPLAPHPKLVGFWRNEEFHRVQKVVETRYEHGETYFRAVTDRGCVDLRRFHHVDARTLRSHVVWEVCAELDAAEILRPR